MPIDISKVGNAYVIDGKYYNVAPITYFQQQGTKGGQLIVNFPPVVEEADRQVSIDFADLTVSGGAPASMSAALVSLASVFPLANTGSSGSGTGNSTTDASQLTGTLPDLVLSSSNVSKNFTPTAIKTAAYTAAANELVKTDATNATVPITLPTGQPDKTRVSVKMIGVSGTNTTTISTSGSNVFNKAGGSTSATLTLLNQAATFQFESATGIWNVISSDVPLSQLDLRFAIPAFSIYTDDEPTGTGTILGSNTALDPLRVNPAKLTGNPVDIQKFTVNGTWTKPANAKMVKVFLVGAGAGGGSGRKGATGTVRCGGGAGAAGGVSLFDFEAVNLTATVSVFVGVGGTGGAAQTVNSTNGNNGTIGTETSFGSYIRALMASTPGGGGTVNSGTSSGTGTTGNYSGSVTGATASTTGGVGNTGLQPVQAQPTTGGAGGGITAANVPSAGGGGGWGSQLVGNTPGPSGGAINTNGGNGTSVPSSYHGLGGAGGGGSITTNGGNGGNGALYGAGGGGGGAATDDVGNSGAGGNGANGIAVIITYF